MKKKDQKKYRRKEGTFKMKKKNKKKYIIKRKNGARKVKTLISLITV